MRFWALVIVASSSTGILPVWLAGRDGARIGLIGGLNKLLVMMEIRAHKLATCATFALDDEFFECDFGRWSSLPPVAQASCLCGLLVGMARGLD